MQAQTEKKAQFHHMKDGTAEDWAIIGGEAVQFARSLSGRIIDHLNLLKDDCGGFPVDRLTHCLQTATLAHKDGKDEEYVVCALIHDIGDTLGPTNHADVAATILEPFVSEKNLWIVKQHAIFQGYYFFHHLGLDRDMRERFRDHEWFRDCAEFCEKYDQNSFDAAYDTLPLEAFEPALRKVFAAPRKSIYVPEPAPGA